MCSYAPFIKYSRIMGALMLLMCTVTLLAMEVGKWNFCSSENIFAKQVYLNGHIGYLHNILMAIYPHRYTCNHPRGGGVMSERDEWVY